jgi:hypothetical protein
VLSILCQDGWRRKKNLRAMEACHHCFRDFCEGGFCFCLSGNLATPKSHDQGRHPHPTVQFLWNLWEPGAGAQTHSQEQTQPPDVYAGASVTRGLDRGPEHCQRPNVSVRATVVQGAAGRLGHPHTPSPLREERTALISSLHPPS